MTNDLIDVLNAELEKRAISMRELARRAHMSPALLSQVLSRNMFPTANFCIKIAPALDIPPQKVLELAGHIPERPNPDPLHERIIAMFDRLNEDNQERAIELLRLLLDSQLLRGRKSTGIADKTPT